MYVILVGQDNTLTATHKERIMQRSKLTDDFMFLIGPEYNNIDMSEFTVYIEYLLPASKRYKTEVLVADPDGYKEYLKYVLPIDTEFTTEPGEIELQVSMVYAGLDENGASIQRVRKTSALMIPIIPIKAWSDVVADEALSVVDRKIIEVESKIKQLEDMADAYSSNKADDIAYDEDTSELQLTSDGKKIGTPVRMGDVVMLDDIRSDDGDGEDGDNGFVDFDDIADGLTSEVAAPSGADLSESKVASSSAREKIKIRLDI